MGPKNNILERRENVMKKLIKANTSRKDSVEAYAVCGCYCSCVCTGNPKVEQSSNKSVKSTVAPSTK